MLFPLRMLAQNVPVKLSPAPTVSATFTFLYNCTRLSPISAATSSTLKPRHPIVRMAGWNTGGLSCLR